MRLRPYRISRKEFRRIQYPDISSGVVPLANNDMRSPYGGEIHRGYIQSWNFTIEHKLPLDLVVSAAYVGTQTTHQFADLDINAGFPGQVTPVGLMPQSSAEQRTQICGTGI